ncbi:UbiA family prenyltransferase [Candidatus Eisenbacteria bacterium]|uniref:UbiA family prenyltransferase n=1 Tax=Eiseniibacteriota bacterium TaxID=2212470 RepID=A0ABV6YPJ1_UNCEI
MADRKAGGRVLKASGIGSRLVDLLFLFRPPLLVASSTFFFIGAISARLVSGRASSFALMPEALPNFLIYVMGIAVAFIVNQIFDVESDAVNKKAYLLPSGIVSRRAAAGLLAAICAVLLIVSALAGASVRYLIWIGLLLGLAYSMPPLRLKARPVLDLMANVAGFAVVGFALGWLVYEPQGPLMWFRLVPYALAMSGIFLNTCIPDEEGDRSVGDRTSCVVFGRNAVARAALVLLGLSGLTGLAVGETLCVLAVVAGLPGFIGVALDPSSRTSVVASQFAARFLLVLVCVKAPVLALLALLTYFASKSYYARRLGVSYPKVTGAERTKSS